MPPAALAASREARRIYLIAIEVRQINPARAGRLLDRVRSLIRNARVLIAARTVHPTNHETHGQ